MAYRDSHAANGRFTSADIRLYGDAIKHRGIVNEPNKNTNVFWTILSWSIRTPERDGALAIGGLRCQ
jgi:hypothetical protein